jgi:hypothetical protein
MDGVPFRAMRGFGHVLGVTCSNMAASSSISCRFVPRARFSTMMLVGAYWTSPRAR